MLDYNKKRPIIELFNSIEGEGSTAGEPTIFVRLSGCNLRCMFSNSICDTAYSSFRPEKGRLSYQDVEDMLKNNPMTPALSITGGEPFLHETVVDELIQIADSYGKFIIVETNGSILVDMNLLRKIDLLNISPKLSSSTPTSKKCLEIGVSMDPPMAAHESRRFNIEALWRMITFSKGYRLKYVIGSESDFEEIEAQIKSLIDYDIKRKKRNRQPFLNDEGDEIWYDIPFIMPWNVILMPAGSTNKELDQNRKMTAEYCVSHGYSYSDRLQIAIWGTEKER